MRQSNRLLRVIRALLLFTVGLLGIGSILATSIMKDEFRSDRENFIIAYIKDANGSLRARGSGTGHDWKDDRRTQ